MKQFDPMDRDAYALGYDTGFGRAVLICLLIAFATAIAFFITSCTDNRVAPEKNSTKPGTNIELPPIMWRIRSREDIAHGWTKSTEKEVCGRQFVDAYVGKDPNGRVVIVTASPQRIDDEVATALGHEVMHVAFGNYHPAPTNVKDDCK